MLRNEWRTRIIESCKAAGTYRDCFEDAIETLASILERRDEAERQFIANGGEAVIIHTNKTGQANAAKNPALVIIDDMNKTALAYWRDLGLTPAGLKRLREFKIEEKPRSPLEKALEELSKD